MTKSRLILNVPYHSQLNNRYNPSGSCNVTSAAMCIKYAYRKAGRDNGWKTKLSVDHPQLEDELYEVMLSKGWLRHSPYDIKKVINLYGVDSTFSMAGSHKNVVEHLNSGNPIITHGYFTAFGHIIVIVGYDTDKRKYIIHDPYGEYFDRGYDTSRSGEFLEISYELMWHKCICHESQWWVHFIGGLI